MKFALLILTLMFSFSVHAALSWHYELEPTAQNPSTFEALQVEQIFSEQKFVPLNNKPGLIPFLHVDQVFSGPQDRVVFYKEGFRPTDQKIFNQIIPIKNGFLFHRLSPTGKSQAFFFYQWNQNDVTRFLQNAKWISGKKTSAAKLMLEMTMPEARAESASICMAASRGLRTQLLQTQEVVDADQIGHVMKTCAVSALQGSIGGVKDIVNGVEDLATGFWSAVKKLVADPEGLWNDTVQKFSELKEVLANIGPQIVSSMHAFMDMDADSRAEIICSTTASIVVQSLIGAGIAKAGVAVFSKMQAIGRIKKMLEVLSRVKKLVPGSERITHEVLACAM